MQWRIIVGGTHVIPCCATCARAGLTHSDCRSRSTLPLLVSQRPGAKQAPCRATRALRPPVQTLWLDALAAMKTVPAVWTAPVSPELAVAAAAVSVVLVVAVAVVVEVMVAAAVLALPLNARWQQWEPFCMPPCDMPRA
eukprot:1207957-Pleurochrysis_carterae.AAC.4